MKLGGCVVIYNPDEKVIDNINTYINFLDLLVVADNSDKKNEYCERISQKDKIFYIDMQGNKGIASALNRSLDYLYQQSFNFALTMDQDSQFPENPEKVLELLDKYSDSFSIIGIGFKKTEKDEKITEEIYDVPHWITSGNFVKLKDFKMVDGFNDDLFIDSVDHEFCWRLKKNGKRIGILKDYYLGHTIGNPGKIYHLFGNHFPLSSNHSAIRYYYRYRNILYLYKIDKQFYKKIFFKEVFVNIPRIVLFDDNRKEKIKMIIKGFKDGKNGIMGKISF